MRILHTSDWHLGRTLDGRCRSAEQEEFIDELCLIARDRKVDALLVAGDVFDTSNPPAAAEQLFYDALQRLSGGGRRAVVVIAGNHDNPERIVAASPLAGRCGIALFGLPGRELVYHNTVNGDGVRILKGGPSWLEFTVPGCDHGAVVLALPYPSEARLRELFRAELDQEDAMSREYSRSVGRALERLSLNFRPDTVNLAMSHIFMAGGAESDSERPIFSLGGACAVDPGALPAGAQYVALGHLHRPQSVAGSRVPCRYSGSPLAYSFSEAGQAKSVTVVDVVPGGPPSIEEIYLKAGRPLVKWRSEEGPARVYNWLEEGRDPTAWIDLEICLDRPLTLDEIHSLRKANPRFVDIRVFYHLPEEHPAAESRAGLPIDELFRRFYHRKYGGTPDDGLVSLFMEILGEAWTGENGEQGEGAAV